MSRSSFSFYSSHHLTVLTLLSKCSRSLLLRPFALRLVRRISTKHSNPSHFCPSYEQKHDSHSIKYCRSRVAVFWIFKIPLVFAFIAKVSRLIGISERMAKVISCDTKALTINVRDFTPFRRLNTRIVPYSQLYSSLLQQILQVLMALIPLS